MPVEENKIPYTSGDQFATDVMRMLQQHKLKLTKPIHFNFFLYLPSSESAEASAQVLRTTHELKTKVSEAVAGAAHPWLCWSEDDFIPTFERLSSIGTTQIELAQTHGGNFDGWDTFKFNFGPLFFLRLLIRLPLLLILLPFKLLIGTVKTFLAVYSHCIGPGLKLTKGFKYLEKQPDKSLKIAQSLLEHPTYKSAALQLMGHAYFKKSNYSEAADAFSRSVEMGDEEQALAEAYLNWGAALDRLEHHQDAITCYRKALELQPDYPSAYYNLANAYAHLQDREQTMIYLQKSIQLRPSNFEKAKADKDFQTLLSAEDLAWVGAAHAADRS